VQGSLEAVADQLNKLPQEKIKVRIIRQGVGAVTEGDVLLAAASNAVVIGFNVRPERKQPRSPSGTRWSCASTRSSTTWRRR